MCFVGNLEQGRELWMQLKAAWRLASVSNCVIPLSIERVLSSWLGNLKSRLTFCWLCTNFHTISTHICSSPAMKKVNNNAIAEDGITCAISLMNLRLVDWREGQDNGTAWLMRSWASGLSTTNFGVNENIPFLLSRLIRKLGNIFVCDLHCVGTMGLGVKWGGKSPEGGRGPAGWLLGEVRTDDWCLRSITDILIASFPCLHEHCSKNHLQPLFTRLHLPSSTRLSTMNLSTSARRVCLLSTSRRLCCSSVRLGFVISIIITRPPSNAPVSTR